jgi:hypothetical protein
MPSPYPIQAGKNFSSWFFYLYIHYAPSFHLWNDKQQVVLYKKNTGEIQTHDRLQQQ